jgi:hypothetical protein
MVTNDWPKKRMTGASTDTMTCSKRRRWVSRCVEKTDELSRTHSDIALSRTDQMHTERKKTERQSAATDLQAA